ncbi:MAG TPA: S8 family serine peptidase [Solirubrobacterales bacterium]|nr:S8 family serine peptidase [Solirubrobacterales bacterium]
MTALIAALTLLTAATASAQSGTIPGHYIVVLKDSVEHPGAVAQRHAENRDARISLIYRHALKGYAAELRPGEAKAVAKDPQVASVEPDARGGVAAQETPTGIERTFALGNESLDIDEEDDLRVDADVAVLDTGIDAEHPDLNVVSQVNCNGGNPPTCVEGGGDTYGHGTHVGGTIGAIDNSFGVVGIAPGARLWSVKVVDDTGFGLLSEYIAGVDWVTARADQIEVANASLGYSSIENSLAFDVAMAASIKAGVVHVAAAGNASELVRYVPGNHPDVITVSALDDADGSPGSGEDPLASFSNYGPLIDVAAPGVGIKSTFPGGQYFTWEGTSMASPHVAGAAAILASEDDPTTRADVEDIRDTIVKSGNLEWSDTSEDGTQEPLLDVGAFSLSMRPTISLGAATGVSAHSATLQASINPRGFATSYQFAVGLSPSSLSLLVPASAKGIGSGTTAVEVEEEISGLAPGVTYYYRVRALNEEGESLSALKTFNTPAVAPSVTTETATAGQTEATLYAKVNPENKATTYQFEYGPTTAYGTKAPVPAGSAGSGTSPVTVSRTISGLSKGMVYHYRIAATNSAGTSYGADRMFSTNVKPTFSTAFSSWDTGENELNQPLDIESNSEGDLWVLDVALHRIQKYSPSWELLDQFGSEGSGAGQFSWPTSITVDSSDNVWVVDSNNHRVQKFSPEGNYLAQFGSFGSTAGKFNWPIDAAIDNSGNIWVTDSNNDRVQKFDSTGKYLASVGSEGSGNGQFSTPYGIAFDSLGSMWVADLGNSRVQKFNSKGEYLTQFGSYGYEPGELTSPTDIDIDANNNLWLVDSDSNLIQNYNAAGQYLARYGTGNPGTEDGEFSLPYGIDVDGSGTIWVADTSNYRIQSGS